MPLTLRARVAWAHDWVSNPALTATFQAALLPGADVSFIVNGAPPAPILVASNRPDFTPVQYIAESIRRPSRQWPARAVTDVQHPHDPGALVDRKDNPINVRLFAEKQVPQRRILWRRRASFRMLVEAQDRRLEFVEPHGRLRRAFCIDVPSV